jgi:Uma2 family endonuclease
MSTTKDLEPPEDIIFPPSELPSDEPPLETDLHRLQMTLLLQCLERLWQNRNDFFADGNLTIYYKSPQPKSEEFRGADFFVVLGTERKPRKSWVVWEEDGKYPNMVVELLSDTTAATEKNFKKQIYQDIFRTPDYFWFNPQTLEFAGFHLVGGSYQPLDTNLLGWLWSKQLGLYLGVYEEKLRFFTSDGQLVPTPEEVAEQEKQKSDRLAAKLRELGIDPDSV